MPKKKLIPVSGQIALFGGIIPATPTCPLFFENSLNLLGQMLKAHLNSKPQTNKQKSASLLKIPDSNQGEIL